MSEYNAIVKSHDIEMSEDGQHITFWMELELPHSGGVGFVMTSPTTKEGNTSFAHDLNMVLNVLGVNKVSEIDGRPLVAVFDGEMFLGSKLIGIKHFLDKCSFMEEK